MSLILYVTLIWPDVLMYGINLNAHPSEVLCNFLFLGATCRNYNLYPCN